MSDTPLREWRFYIDDVIACAQKVAAYTDGASTKWHLLPAD
jgi:uncharacterized protein with HEPN domain